MLEQIKPPSPEIVKAVSNLLDERNVIIPLDNVEVVSAAFSHWLEHTPRGQEYMAYLLQLDAVPGRSEKNYNEKDGYGRLTKEIKPESIIFVRGCIINGESYPISQVEITERERVQCESCGSFTICVEDVDTPYGKRNLCAHCSSCDENSGVKESSDHSCEDCTYSGCSWHPVNIDAPPFEQVG